uniref:Uncharacterized protein n=1 Tax=Arundo donax TaxID=35708 RepID=A0A0A9AGL4_ARUDO
MDQQQQIAVAEAAHRTEPMEAALSSCRRDQAAEDVTMAADMLEFDAFIKAETARARRHQAAEAVVRSEDQPPRQASGHSGRPGGGVPAGATTASAATARIRQRQRALGGRGGGGVQGNDSQELDLSRQQLQQIAPAAAAHGTEPMEAAMSGGRRDQAADDVMDADTRGFDAFIRAETARARRLQAADVGVRSEDQQPERAGVTTASAATARVRHPRQPYRTRWFLEGRGGGGGGLVQGNDSQEFDQSIRQQQQLVGDDGGEVAPPPLDLELRL